MTFSFGKPKATTTKSGSSSNLFNFSGGLSESEQFEMAIKLSLEEEERNKKPETTIIGKDKSQWVKDVTSYSTEYTAWPAKNVIGASNTYPKYGDIKTAWAPSQPTGTHEYLELLFADKVIPKTLKVYETYNPGALVKVSGKNPKGDWITLWQGARQTNPGKAVINEVKLKKVDFLVNAIRLDLDCTAQAAYYEIDAVELLGEEVRLPVTLNVPVSFANWYENSDFSDFTFIVKESKIPAHKFVLANASKKLEALCSKDEYVVEFPEEEFTLALKFIYTGRYSLTQKLTPGVLKVADAFDLVELRKGCFDFMVASLNKETVIETMIRAQKKDFDFDATDLIQKCVEFIQERAYEVFPEKSLFLFDKDIMISLVQGDKLAIDEYELFESILKWGKNKCETNKEDLSVYLKDVLSHVRWPLMDAEVLYTKVKPSRYITENEYLEALEYNLDNSIFSTTEKRFARRGTVFKGSQILNSKTGSHLLKWLPKTDKNWTVLYRATTHGWDAANFHAQCDGKGETITVIKSSSGNVFGGYNPESWSQSGQYTNNLKTFIFTLINTENVPPSKLSLISGKNGAYNCSGYGPTFGGGHDLYICSNSNTVTSNYSNYGNSFTSPPGFNDTTKKQRLLAGSYNFQVSEIEVFGFK